MSGGLENYEGRRFCAIPEQFLGESASGDLCRWLKAPEPITWLIANAWPGFDIETVAGAFQQACDMWSAVCNVTFRRVPQAPADITIHSRNMGAPGGVLAEALLPCPPGNSPLWARYDDREPWIIALNPPSNKIDMVRVMGHELAHGLGIGHLPAGSSNLMAPTYSTRIAKPQPGDIAEALARYGPPVDPTDPPPPPPVGESILIRIPKSWVVDQP